MSKTSPNAVAIDEAPQSMYQKLISIRDDLIVPYFELATDMMLEEVEVIKNRLESGEHPNKLKEELAQRIIVMYHGTRYDPSDKTNIEQITMNNEQLIDGKIEIGNLLKILWFCATSWDVRNALAGKSVRVDGVVIEDPKYLVLISQNGTLIEMGKKKAKRVTL